MILEKFNFRLMLFLAICHFIAIFLTPVAISIMKNYLCWLMMLPSLILTNTTWALIHEGIHSNLSANKKTNLKKSRLLSLFIHGNFEVLKFGHLMHHRYNRTDYDLTDGYDDSVPALCSKHFNATHFIQKIKANLLYYSHITFGLYFVELIGPLFFLLPIAWVAKVAEKMLGSDHGFVINAKSVLFKPERLRRIRLDNIINIAVLGLIISFYGSLLWGYLIFLAVRAFLISSIDNLPHYGTSLDRITGAYNLKTSKIWQSMILNFNLHRVHHKHPNVAWHLLPKEFTDDKETYDQKYFTQYLRQWGGVIPKKDLESNV